MTEQRLTKPLIPVAINRRRFLTAAAIGGGGLLSAAALPTWAQQGSSSGKRISRFVVPFGPGGSTDTITRIIAHEMSNVSGENFIVENKPGGSGIIAANEVLRAPADGSSILPITPTFVIAQYINSKLPFDTRTDFKPIGVAMTQPLYVVVSPSLNIKTLDDLKKYVVNKKAPLTYSTAGNGSVPHLSMEYLRLLTGIDMLHVSYKSGGESITAVLSGQVDASLLTSVEIDAHVNAGKMIPIASTGTKRSSAYPNIPTLQEQGVKDYEMIYFTGFVVRGNVPESEANRLSSALQKALKEKPLLEKLAKSGDIAVGSIEEANEILKKNHALWARTAKEANISLL